LKLIFGDDQVETQSEAAYNAFVSAFWSAQQREITPACVFKPEKALDVSTSILRVEDIQQYLVDRTSMAESLSASRRWARLLCRLTRRLYLSSRAIFGTISTLLLKKIMSLLLEAE
jgi:hypothetical protein